MICSLHRYLYWIDNDRNVRFIDLSSTLQPTNLITSSSQFLSGGITAFTVDLIESQFIYVNESHITQRHIGGGVVQTTNFEAGSSPLSLMVSFAGEVLTYSSGKFTSYENGIQNSEFSGNFGRSQVSAMTLVRTISQPQPGESRNIKYTRFVTDFTLIYTTNDITIIKTIIIIMLVY